MSDFHELDEPLMRPPVEWQPLTVRLTELETVALAQREQRYPVENVGPASVSDTDGLRELLGFGRCAVCRIWIAPEDERCPRCEVPVHRKGGDSA
jgi:uncharacterized paraquat-inducible protein A